MKCKICGVNSNKIFTAKVLKKFEVAYFFCKNCGFLQTEEPYWLDEAYNNAIGIEDTGILKRNILFSKRTSAVINFLFSKNSKFVDYAGGYGIFVRMMRDLGFDFYWSDPYAKNILARGFEYNNKDKIELITAFECFEHFNEPIFEINEMLKISDNILFSTRIFEGTPPNPNEWWYYNFNGGQHISIYSIKTLKFIADKMGLHLSTNNKSFHLLSKKAINNFTFNLLLKLSQIGLSDVLKFINKSKTDSDFNLLSD